MLTMLFKLCLLIWGGISDWKTREIPDSVPLGLIGLSIGELITAQGASIAERLIMTGAVITWILMIEFLAAKGKGTPTPGGDIKLLIALAFSEGIISFVATMVGSGILVAAVKLFDRKGKIKGLPLCTYAAGSYGILTALVLL